MGGSGLWGSGGGEKEQYFEHLCYICGAVLFFFFGVFVSPASIKKKKKKTGRTKKVINIAYWLLTF